MFAGLLRSRDCVYSTVFCSLLVILITECATLRERSGRHDIIIYEAVGAPLLWVVAMFALYYSATCVSDAKFRGVPAPGYCLLYCSAAFPQCSVPTE